MSFHDAARGDRADDRRRPRRPGVQGPQPPASRRAAGEDLRLLYVALTRAKHQAVVWWASAWDSQHSPLGRLLFAKDAQGKRRGGRRQVHPRREGGVSRRLDELGARGPGLRQRRALDARADRASGARPCRAAAQLLAARFDRHLDLRWRRTSYSDITAAAHEGLVSSEPEESVLHRRA